MRIVPWLLVIWVGGSATATPARGQAEAQPKVEEIAIKGRVVAPDGRPVAGAIVAHRWQNAPSSTRNQAPGETTTADADGRFSLAVSFFNDRPEGIVADSADGKLGGWAKLEPGKLPGVVEVVARPLVWLHGIVESADPAFPVQISTVLLGPSGEDFELAESSSFDDIDFRKKTRAEDLPKPGFSFRLPPGTYSLMVHEPTSPSKHAGAAYQVEIKGDEPNGERVPKRPVTLPLSPLATLEGKPAPALKVKDARGVPKGVKLADFKGKWVLLDFWATWCGPCVREGLPDTMDYVDDHPEALGKLVVLAIHSSEGAEDFAAVDKAMAPVVRDLWYGRELPFPILLDDDGKTFAAYGVESIPETVLIDPEGNICPGGIERLDEAFPEPPVDVRVARALGRSVDYGIQDGDRGGLELDMLVESIAGQARVDIAIDADSLKRANVDPKARVPLAVMGPVSLQTWLRLALDPFGLSTRLGPEGIVVFAAKPGERSSVEAAPSRFLDGATKKAARVLGEPVDADGARIDAEPLGKVAETLSQSTGVAIVLDPADRLAGKVDRSAKVSADLGGKALGEALKAMLDPIGLEAAPTGEIIVVRRKRP